MVAQTVEHALGAIPDWLPDGARHYLVHTEAGLSIRAVARQVGLHASTVSRQVRRFEQLRDDPLVDEGLRHIGEVHLQAPSAPNSSEDCMPMKHVSISTSDTEETQTPSEETLSREGRRVLRRLCETGAVLAVAGDMDNAVIVRDGADGSVTRTAVVDRNVARAMAVQEWIACSDPESRIARYRITSVGRAALKRMLAASESRAAGFAEAQSSFGHQHRSWGEKTVQEDGSTRGRRLRYNLAESPLAALARRKDKSGQPFLSDELVSAGERLREDFELAQMGPRVTQNWEGFLTAGTRGSYGPSDGIGGPETARNRVQEALSDLGPGLGDVVLRCCCFLEGLESTEKRMGWSARSGKIVLRIALTRLRRHYEERHGRHGPLIG